MDEGDSEIWEDDSELEAMEEALLEQEYLGIGPYLGFPGGYDDWSDVDSELSEAHYAELMADARLHHVSPPTEGIHE